MKKSIVTLALLAVLSVSAFADGQIGSTFSDGQIGSTKTCPTGQTCTSLTGQIGSTLTSEPTAGSTLAGFLEYIGAFLAQL